MGKLLKIVSVTGMCVYLLGAANPAAAGPFLKCYKVKDVVPKAKHLVDIIPNLPPNSPELQCTIQTGAKFCCDPVDLIFKTPPPPGGGPIAHSSRFCCYKLKCPKGSATLPVQDTFGARVLSASKAGMLCAPASPSGAFLDDSDAF